MNRTPSEILELYVKGKDQNEYGQLETIYSKTAEVIFEIHSSKISFPSIITGNQEIARILSRDFNLRYDSIKTYYLSKPPVDQLYIKNQTWLVVMRDKDTDKTRVGTGYYDWELQKENGTLKIIKHKIVINVMLEIEDHSKLELNTIQNSLEYPWVQKTQVLSVLSQNSKLKEIQDSIK